MNKLPEVMRGVQLVGHGDFDQLQIRNDIPVPAPGPQDVLIKVTAAGVNNTDLNTRVGWYAKENADVADGGWAGDPLRFPRIQGADVCGRVVAKGSEVDHSLLGKRVLVEPCLREADGEKLDSPWYFGSECDGGFAEYTRVAAVHAHPVQSKLSDTELASFPCSYSTAENLLTRCRVTSGDVVLVTGASGGVGSAAVQLARARGAKVLGVAGSAKADGVMSLGATTVIPRNESILKALGKNSVDVIIDLVAGEKWPELLEVLRPFGRYGVAGAIAGPHVELDVRTLYLKDQSFFGCTVLDQEVFPNLIKRIEANEIRPLVAKAFALEQIVEAQKYFQTKKHLGKLVLDINLERGNT